jgi:MFS family permease
LHRLLASPLWRRPDFVKFWAAATVSLSGSAVTLLALPLIAIGPLRASPFEVGVLGGAQFLPYFLIGLPAGAIVDRLARKRRLLVTADVIRAVCLLSVPLAYTAGALSFAQLYAVAFVNGLLSVFFDIASVAYLPALISREELVDGNAKLELSRSSSEVVGPGMAGLLVQLAGAPFALLADALSFAVSGALLSRVRGQDPPIGAAPAGPRVRGLFAEVLEGTRYVFQHPYLRAIALTTTAANFFRTGLLAVLLVYLVRDAGASAGAIGLALALGNVGFVGAALIAPGVARHFGIGRTMQAAVSSFGPAALLVLAAPRQLAVVATGLMVLVDSFGIGLHGVNQVSVRQAVTPDGLRGRMAATLRFLNIGTMPLGALAGGALGSVAGLRPAMYVCTVGLFLAAAPYTLSSTRKLAELPRAAPDVS